MNDTFQHPRLAGFIPDPHITSAQNPRVKLAVGLRDRHDRDREGLYIIEGYRALRRGLDYGVAVRELFVCPEFFQGENEPALLADYRKAGTQIYTTTPAIFGRMAYRERPEGLLGVAPQVRRGLAAINLTENSLLLIAVAIEKPGNLGTILRSADATGVTGLVICDRCTDLYNPNVVRASTGTLFSVPIAESNTEDTLAWLATHKIPVLAATPHTTNNYTDVDMRGPVAIAVGCEMTGLNDAWMNRATMRVKIPMLGMADSLNVATATTILLYEAARQRNWKPARA